MAISTLYTSSIRFFQNSNGQFDGRELSMTKTEYGSAMSFLYTLSAKTKTVKSGQFFSGDQYFSSTSNFT